MTNNINHIEILPWSLPKVASPYPPDSEVIQHLRGEGWTVKEIVEFMNATKKSYGGNDRLLTFDQWEDAAMAWVA